MKHLLFTVVLLLIIFISSHAQAPQGINYQAVAYDGTGLPVTNQLLGVRLTVLDGSATGTTVYQESHATTTDNTGLFSLVIGMGNVISGTFAGINWGNGSKWLKTEIDITGGTNYVVIGNSQFMSVPYALYANSTSFSSGSFSIPDGFDNVTPVIIPDSTDYIVPAGKNIYLQTPMHLRVDNADFHTFVSAYGADSRTFVGASPNSVVWTRYGTLVAFLVDKKVDWTSIDLTSGASFTVPANKQFVIVTYSFLYDNNNIPGPMPAGCAISINGNLYPTPHITLTNSILDEGTILTSTGCTDPGFCIAVNGYLKDKRP